MQRNNLYKTQFGRLKKFALMPLLVILCHPLLASDAGSDNAQPTPLGRQLDTMSVVDYRGKEYVLSDFSNKDVLVVAFLGVEEPNQAGKLIQRGLPITIAFLTKIAFGGIEQ